MSVDPRGVRFSAWLTTAVLVAALVTAVVSTPAAGAVVLGQAVVFGLGAIWPHRSPYGLVFKAVLAGHLGPPRHPEPAGPVRFAQGVGFGFAVLAAAGFLAGAPILGAAATAAALVAAFLNAAFGLCLACKVYPFIRLYLIRRPQGAHS